MLLRKFPLSLMLSFKKLHELMHNLDYFWRIWLDYPYFTEDSTKHWIWANTRTPVWKVITFQSYNISVTYKPSPNRTSTSYIQHQLNFSLSAGSNQSLILLSQPIWTYASQVWISLNKSHRSSNRLLQVSCNSILRHPEKSYSISSQANSVNEVGSCEWTTFATFGHMK